MTHASVITLLEDVAKSLGDSVRFGYGSLDDFNSISNKVYPFIWLEPIKGEFPVDESGPSSTLDFDMQLIFLNLDSVKGAERETAETWDKSFDLMEQFVHKLNRFVMGDSDLTGLVTSNNIEITQVRFEPYRKITGDALTGWTLNLRMLTPTEFNYCSIYES